MEKCHFVNIFCNFLADFQNIEKGCFVNRFRVAESDGGANFPHCALQLLRASGFTFIPSYVFFQVFLAVIWEGFDKQRMEIHAIFIVVTWKLLPLTACSPVQCMSGPNKVVFDAGSKRWNLHTYTSLERSFRCIVQI